MDLIDITISRQLHDLILSIDLSFISIFGILYLCYSFLTSKL